MSVLPGAADPAADVTNSDPADHAIDCLGLDQPHTSAEWLLTNGLGGFAMGTASGVNTRRYHGLLIAPRRPPVQRVNTVTALGESVSYDDQTVELFNHPFRGDDGVALHAPEGWRHLNRFELRTGHWCRWTYQLDGFQLIVSLQVVLVRGSLAVGLDGQPTRIEHLHHHGRTRTRQARDDGDE